MSRNGEKSNSSDHVNEIHQGDNEFDSILNVIRRSNMDPYKICLKRIIGELPVRDVEFDSVEKFKKRLVEICNEEINGDFVNMDFDLLSKCCKEIINTNYGSINFNKAALLLESSAKVYSSKVDHLHSLVTQAAKNAKKRSQPEQTEEDDFWVPDDIEVDPNCTLSPDDTTASLINFVKPPADLVLEGDGLDATGDGETLESYSLAKSVLYRDFLLLDPCDTAAVDENLKAEVDVRKGKHGGDKGSSQPSKSSDGRYPADGGYVPRNVHEDDSAHCQGDFSGYENLVPDAKIKEHLHPLLDSSLANIGVSEEQTEMAARVSLWKQKIKQDLEEHEARPAFDVNNHGKRVLQKLSESGDLGNKVPFADVVLGEEKHDVARSFAAVMHLANNGNIDLQKSGTDDEEVISASPFTVKFLRLLKRQPAEPEVQFRSSKRRAVSQTNEGESKDMRGRSGKENCEP